MQFIRRWGVVLGVAAMVLAASGCGGGGDTTLEVKQMPVAGATLDYTETGSGPTVVLVHGALADHRIWQRHQQLLAPRYRAVSYSQRYFGAAPWHGDWPPFGVAVHASDLAAFIRKLGAGRVHLVAWSYAGHIALQVAKAHPELVRSVFVYEPGEPSYVTDAAQLNAWIADANAMFTPIFGAVDGGDLEGAVRLLLDGSGQRAGYFDAQPALSRRIERDNARTLPLQLRQSPPPAISCADLAALTVPVSVVHGERSRPVFGVVSRAAAACIGGAQHGAVAGATHMWPDEQPAAFVARVQSFIDLH